MSRATILFAGLGVVLAGLALHELSYAIRVRTEIAQTEAAHRQAGASLYAELIAPGSASGEEVLTGPGERVEFVYALHNAGKSAIQNLRMTGACGCHVTRQIPARITAGETVQFGFELRSPDAGRNGQSLSLVAEGQEEPLVVLHPAVRSRVDPPRLVHYPPRLSLSWIRGETPAAAEVLLTSLEFADSEPMIGDLHPVPDENFEIEDLGTSEKRGFEPGIVRRTYRCLIRARELTSGGGFLFVAPPEEGGEPLARIPVEVRAREPVEIVPSRLSLDIDTGNEARAIVVQRGTHRPEVRLVEFDRDMLAVERVPVEDAAISVYSTRPSSNAQPATTIVAFAVGEDGPRLKLPVELQKFTKGPSK